MLDILPLEAADLYIGEMVLRMVVSILLGGLIGLERETHERPAGLRTHILVAVGATLYTICSYSVAGHQYDPGRITAQIVTGIGFLGAGTIIRQGSIIRGLTTAASIWTVAAIGIAVGIGGIMFYVATAASILVFATLTFARNLERILQSKPHERVIVATLAPNSETVTELLTILSHHGTEIRLIESREAQERTYRTVKIRMVVGRDFDENAIGTEIINSGCITRYYWE